MVADFRGMGPLAAGWALGLVAGSVVLAWLYREGRRSVLLVAAWHTAFNLVSATEATGAVAGTITSVLVICWAVWVMLREKAPHASRPTPSLSNAPARRHRPSGSVGWCEPRSKR